MEPQAQNKDRNQGTDVGFTLLAIGLPLLFSAIYYECKLQWNLSSGFSFAWTLGFSILWYYLGAVAWRRGVRGFFALWLVHLPATLSLMFSVATFMTMPETPKFIKTATAWGSYYLMSLEGVSVPPLIYTGLVFGDYYKYLPLAPIIAALWMWALFYIGYMRAQKKEDYHGRKI